MTTPQPSRLSMIPPTNSIELVESDDLEDVMDGVSAISLPRDIEIFVMDLNGSSRAFSINPTNTFQDLVESVYEDGIPDGLRCIFQSKQVDPFQTIDSAGYLLFFLSTSLFLF